MSRGAALRRRIGPRSAGMSMTAEEFDRLPEDRWTPGYRYEVLNGLLVATPPPAAGERAPNDELGSLLRAYKRTHPQGSALDETLPEQTLATTPNRRRCDRAVWVGLGRTPNLDRDAPAIVVEFVSAARRDRTRDYQAKREEYRHLGVREYWIIDRFRRQMLVVRFEPGEGAPTEVIVREGERYQTELLPGFVLPLAVLLEQADIWQSEQRPGKPRPPDGGTS